MTRQKWVALAIGLAVIAVLVPYGPALWLAVAYEEERLESAEPGVVTSDMSIPMGGLGVFVLGDEGSSFVPPNYVVLTSKRFSWGPGPESWLLCGWCVDQSHSRCSRRVAYCRDEPDDRIAMMWLCSCPHPSHAQESVAAQSAFNSTGQASVEVPALAKIGPPALVDR